MKKRLDANNVSLRWERDEPNTVLHPKDRTQAIAQGSIVEGQRLTFADCDMRTWDVYSKFSNNRKGFDLHATYKVSVNVKRKGDRNG